MIAESTVTSHGQQRLPQPTRERWQPLRAGLQNIWQYDDQRFTFHRGRLLLRGRNGAGKSKALEVLLPFLLDADLAPQRLDPFGSTARQMRWNLLNDTNPDTQVRIGYVWLEFGRQGEQGSEYCTVGACLRAHRSGSGVDASYFVTHLRPDVEVNFWDSQRTPLARGALIAALGEHGTAFDRKADYRREVNRRLFDLPPEQYDALIGALLELRRPQLSKQLQPAALSRILSVSLPPLDGSIIGQLAEGFERLERHRAERDTLQQAREQVEGFLKIYRRYAAAHVRWRARDLTAGDSAYQSARGQQRDKTAEHAAATEVLAKIAEEITSLNTAQQTCGAQLEALRASDAYRAVENLDRLRREAKDAGIRAQRTSAFVQREDEAHGACVEKERLAVAALEKAQAELAERRQACHTAAVQAALAAAQASLDRCVEDGAWEDAAALLDATIAARTTAVRRLEVLVKEVDTCQRQLHSAEDRLHDAEEQLSRAQARLRECEAAEHAARQAFAEAVDTWLTNLTILQLDADTRLQLVDIEPHLARPWLAAPATAARATLHASDTQLALREEQLVKERGTLEAERVALSASTHRSPAAPPWRTAARDQHAGAPLYMLCDFATADAASADLEAALEAAGLLDAWVTPAGTVLAAATGEALLIPAPRDSGPTLADVLAPVESAVVGTDVIRDVLRSVGLVQGEGAPPSGSWVGCDGRFQLGPLSGRWTKPGIEYIGAAARERARQRRLAQLAELAAACAASLAELAAQRTDLHQQMLALEGEVDAFPSAQQVVEARAQLDAMAPAVSDAAARLELAERGVHRCREGVALACEARDSEAAAHGLTAWIDALAELREHTAHYGRRGAALLNAGSQSRDRAVHLSAQREAVGVTAARLAERTTEHRDAEDRAARLRAEHEILAANLGATPEAILAQVDQLVSRRRDLAQQMETARGSLGGAERRVGLTEGEVVQAGERVQELDAARHTAKTHFKDCIDDGLAAVLGIEFASEPAAWSFTDALLAARHSDAQVPAGDCDSAARDQAENRVVQRHQELLRSLPPHVRLMPRRCHNTLVYDALLSSRTCTLLALAEDLGRDVAQRDNLLDQQEADLFESFLSGETHEHLRARLREAHALVAKMNEELSSRPTASGMRLRLRWLHAEDLPPDTEQAIALLLRAGTLLSRGDREALGQFLRQRLSAAREADSGALSENMLAVLNYRDWFYFAVEYRQSGGEWKRLTSKAHAAGSGGEKAVMLHMPLFAAASAFYAACPQAPRLIMLDEAFAGIDRGMRGQLMGLLASFDLDFLMTSYDEWGFYKELDGLATYHLATMEGLPGIYTEWFLWDGEMRQEMGAG